jgi:hypothetical protein
MSKWIPTRKWLFATVTGAIGLGVMLLTGDPAVTDPEKVAIGGYLSAAAGSYILPDGE